MLNLFSCHPTHLVLWMRCRSGCAPDSALTFFASPKKVSKERRAQDKTATRFLALLGPALKGVGDKDKLQYQYQYQTPAHAPEVAPRRAFSDSAVGIGFGICCLTRRYEEASSADGGGSGAQVFEAIAEFLRTPLRSSNAACPRSGPTNPARLLVSAQLCYAKLADPHFVNFAYFLLAKQKKVSAQSGAQPDQERNNNNNNNNNNQPITSP
jgi:hypothetical protein